MIPMKAALSTNTVCDLGHMKTPEDSMAIVANSNTV